MSDLRALPWPFEVNGDARSSLETAPRTTATAVGEWGRHVFDLGDDYQRDMARRRQIVSTDPSRFRALPHMDGACWDYLLWAMRRLSEAYPHHMSFYREGARYRWINRLLDIDQHFELPDNASLPEHPLLFIAMQVPDDVLLLSDRDGQLRNDAALVTSPAAAANRNQSLLAHLTPDEIVRRIDWTLDASRPQMIGAKAVTQWYDGQFGAQRRDEWSQVQLRIELEHLTRLPVSGAIVVNIRTYAVPLSDIARYPAWAQQLADAVVDLPVEIANLKGIDDFRAAAMDWLRLSSRRHEARRELAIAATSI